MESKPFHSIKNLFKRDQETHVLLDVFSRPEFASIYLWEVHEKIDGTNIRIELTPDGEVNIHGRTNKAQMAPDLLDNLREHFTPELMRSIRKDGEDDALITLYGEGYGPGIQKAGKFYREDKFFILFDVLIGNTWWLGNHQIADIADKLGIEMVPSLGTMTTDQIVDLVKEGFESKCAIKPKSNVLQAEGVIAKPIAPLFNNKGERVMFKLKTVDYTKVEPVALIEGSK